MSRSLDHPGEAMQVVALTAPAHLLRFLAREEIGHLRYVAFEAIALPLLVCYLFWQMHGINSFWSADGIMRALVFSAGTSMSQIGAAVLQDRFRGRMALICTLPLGPTGFLIARVLLSCLPSIVVIGAGLSIFYVTGLSSIEAAQMAHLMAVAVFTVCSLSALGLIVALTSRSLDTGWTIISTLVISLALCSPVFYRIDEAPTYLQLLIWLSPFTPLAVQTGSLLSQQSAGPSCLAVSMASAVILIAIARLALRWTFR